MFHSSSDESPSYDKIDRDISVHNKIKEKIGIFHNFSRKNIWYIYKKRIVHILKAKRI